MTFVRTAFAPLAALVATATLCASGCDQAEQGSVFIEGVLPVVPDDCTADAGGNTFISGTILDIGLDAAGANALTLATKVTTNLPATLNTQQLNEERLKQPSYPNYGNADTNIVTFNASEIFFTTDADRDGETALKGKRTPTSDANARVTGLGGTVFNVQTGLASSAAIIVTAVTKEDAAELQAEPFISEALQGDPANTIVIFANIRVLGQTTGAGAVRSPPFTFPVTLCQGCLVPVCPDGQNLVALAEQPCFVGQDAPSFECQ